MGIAVENFHHQEIFLQVMTQAHQETTITFE